MSRRAGVAFILLGLAGLALAGASTYVHVQLLRNPAYVSFCNVSAAVNCDTVYRSRFAMARGVPVAVFGWTYYFVTVVLGTAAIRGAGRFRENAPAYIFVLSTAALSVTLYLAYVSFRVLHAACLLCIGSYAATIGIFLVAGSAAQVPMLQVPRRLIQDLGSLARRPSRLAVGLVVVVICAGAVAAFPVLEQRGARVAQKQFLDWWRSLPRQDIPISGGGAEVVVVKFNDFQCPPCGNSHLAYKPLFEKYRDHVRLVLQDYPLNPDCNPYVNVMVHPAACEAAVAARAAAAQGKADQFEEYLYRNQQALAPADLRRYAQEAGLSLAAFEAAMAARALVETRREIELGRRLGVTRTPTFFINGKKVEGALSVQFFEEALQYEIAHASSRR